MATPERTNRTITSDSEQYVLNKSQDAKYDVLAVELLAENSAGTALVRLKTNDSGGINISSGLVTSAYDSVSITAYDSNDNPTTIVYKSGPTTVGTLTLSYDSQGRFTGVVRA